MNSVSPAPAVSTGAEATGDRPRVYLSPPDVGEAEARAVASAVASGWVAPLGPEVDAFEAEFARVVGVRSAAAVASGTAALHLALLLAGVRAGDRVLVSTLTFAATVNPIIYLGATPVLIDSEPRSWNMDPELAEAVIERDVRAGARPAAVVLVHLYGQCADIAPITACCARHGIPLIEDAAEALGSTYHGRSAGSFGFASIFSFNGNKIITSSGGGMLVSDDPAVTDRARWLATQARDPEPHYEHSVVGYNYRMSNILAALGRVQLGRLEARVQARRATFVAYEAALGSLPGLSFAPEAAWGRHTRWLTTVLIDPLRFGADRESVRVALERENIESRPLWKPMHLQPVFSSAPYEGGRVSEQLFEQGLCLPSGSSLQPHDRARTIDVIRSLHRSA
jgi:dTDP-4-amino-4,6-dideoxygalactose transaminase